MTSEFLLLFVFNVQEEGAKTHMVITRMKLMVFMYLYVSNLKISRISEFNN